MAYYDTRPVIVRSTHKDRKSHYVMTAKEAGEHIVKVLTESDHIIGVEIIPVDGVSDKIAENAALSKEYYPKGD